MFFKGKYKPSTSTSTLLLLSELISSAERVNETNSDLLNIKSKLSQTAPFDKKQLQTALDQTVLHHIVFLIHPFWHNS